MATVPTEEEKRKAQIRALLKQYYSTMRTYELTGDVAGFEKLLNDNTDAFYDLIYGGLINFGESIGVKTE